MAKNNKDKAASRKAEREAARAEAARLLAAERKREKLRTGGLLALFLVGILVLSFFVFVKPFLDDKAQTDRIANLPIDDIGATPEAAGCEPVKKVDITVPTKGWHVKNGTELSYEDAPPAYGVHWERPMTLDLYRTFFSDKDRPPKERLVHSLEHGYTIIWYDDTLAADSGAVADMKAIADELRVSDAVITAPWTSTDGGAFPEGTHLALTHWSTADGEKGVWQYCAGVSGEAVKDFIIDYPHADGPEGGFD